MAVRDHTFSNVRRVVHYGVQEVAFRERWTDEWEVQEHIYCEHAVWSAAPSLPTATLSWRYGEVVHALATRWVTEAKLTGVLRRFVRIRFDMELFPLLPDFTHRYWYGVLEISQDFLGGGRVREKPKQHPNDPTEWQTTPVGEQHLVCYGLEKLLVDQQIDHSYWRSGLNAPHRIERGLTFNRGGRKNRTEQKLDGQHHFAATRQDAEYWSSRDCVEYLLANHTPRNTAGQLIVPFRLDDPAPEVVPTWDHPELPTEKFRVYDLLEQLMPRQRLIGWYCDVDEDKNEVLVKPFTFTEADIGVVVEGGQPLPANKSQIKIDFESDPSADVAIKLSALDRIDEVLVRGARRRSCFSTTFEDATIVIGWTPTEEGWYEKGASEEEDYPPPSEVAQRQQRNAEARQRDAVSRVYARFELDSDWDGRLGNMGLEPDDPDYTNAGHVAFPQDVAAPDANDPFPAYILEMELEPTTPLLMGVDYSGDKVERGTVDESTATSSRDEMPLVVFWRIPGTDDPKRYINIEAIGALFDVEEEDADEDNHAWSAHVSVIPHSRAFEIRVHGQPQHVIAKTDFTPLPEDEDLGGHDYRQMIVTCSVLDDRYCEARWPDPPVEQGDALRRLTIDAGDGYKQDYIAPQTVVGVDARGRLIRTTGGYIRNDSPLLKAAAQVAYSWYGRERAVLELHTHLISAELFVGDLITEIGQIPGGNTQTLNTVVTEVEIFWPTALDGEPPAPSMKWTTAAGELDPLRMIGSGGGPLRGEARVVLPRRPIKL